VRGEEQMDSTKAVLTDDMKQMIARIRLCYVATVTPDGKPNLSPKGSIKVLDSEHLIFADIASPATVENLGHNPFIEVNVVDPVLRRGYRFKGTAEVTVDPGLLEFAGMDLGHPYPVLHAVKIPVEEVYPVRSPIYTIAKVPERQVKDTWLRNYGYRAIEGPEE
jgi:hypothetical protein